MKATDFAVGDCISDGDRVGWIVKLREGREKFLDCRKSGSKEWHSCDCLPGNDWHRLIPECVLTEATRVTDLQTIEEDEQVIIQLPDGNIVAREWYGDCSSSEWKVYRDPRPLPRIIAAKGEGMNCPECEFEIAKLKAELELIDQEHKSELANVTAERDALLKAAKYAYKKLNGGSGLHPRSIIGVKVLDKLLAAITKAEETP